MTDQLPGGNAPDDDELDDPWHDHIAEATDSFGAPEVQSLLDTHIALIATYTAVNLPIVVWLMRDFFAGIPIDLEESAAIDGASKLGIFFTIH